MSEPRTVSPPVSSDPVQFLTFKVGDSEYGVDIMSVREVKGWTPTTRLPNRPEFVLGVLNLRGLIVPIFDLRSRFGQGATNTTEKHVIIIIAIGEQIAGALVDAVSDILTIGADEVKLAPNGDLDIDDHFVKGLIAVEYRMVILLDMKKLLSNDVEALSENQNIH